MGLCRYLPIPSDRMAIMWSLLSVKDSLILEYGPAGTTHFSMGFFGKMNIDQENRLFTTHMSEDDVVMGDVSRLEEAILELDDVFSPKVIFVVASSVSSVIGTDVKGVCNYMQKECIAKLLAFEQGGFNGDYSIGLQKTYSLITKNIVAESDIKKDTFNIIGASMENYRMISDVKEIESMMKESFDYDMGVALCLENSIENIEKMSTAKINLVLSYEGLEAAEYLKEKFGTPFIYGLPYGYKGSLNWLKEISTIIGCEINKDFKKKIDEKIIDSSFYDSYRRMFRKNIIPTAYIYADYDKVNSLGDFLIELGIEPKFKICKHSLRIIKDPREDIKNLSLEKDRIDILENLNNTLVLADDVSISLVNKTNTCLRITLPFIRGSQVATHLPFVGIKGADFIRETVDTYYGNLF